MNITDPIADLLTRIRNAQKSGAGVVKIPASKLKITIVHILQTEGFIKAYKCVRDGQQGMIKVALKYRDFEARKIGIIRELERVSKPGRRVYVDATKLPYVRNGFGIGIISTSKGVMTCKDARKNKIGGEYLCKIF